MTFRDIGLIPGTVRTARPAIESEWAVWSTIGFVTIAFGDHYCVISRSHAGDRGPTELGRDLAR